MQYPTLLPDPEVVQLDYLSATDDHVTLVLRSIQPTVSCPTCGQVAHRKHSSYTRHLQELPWNGVPVRLRVQVRRFFCDTPDCNQRIFAERLPITERYARRTGRQRAALQLVAFALGGEGGARVAAGVGMPISPDTLLRLLHTDVPSAAPTPRVLGLDDFAFRKGQVYGTLLVDLERGVPIDLLPDRRAETLAAWLKAHPGVGIISRDRGGAYADGARQGAPEAQQVADRWHLLKNLAAALEATLLQEHEALRDAARPPRDPETIQAEETPPAGAASPRAPTRSEREKSLRQERKQGQAAEVVALYEAGHAVQHIARLTGLDRKTVRKYVQARGVPPRKSRAPRPGQLTPYEAYLRQRWAAGCHNATELWREIQTQGYRGGRTQVQTLLSTWRVVPPMTSTEPGSEVLEKVWKPSPRTVVWWLLGPSEKRTRSQQAFTERLLERSPTIHLAQELVQEFFGLVRRREAEKLEDWMRRVGESEIPALRSFGAGLRRDWEAVVAGMTLPWSNGPVEGQVNRLKMLKRQMYGRAGFAVLRARVLHRG